MNTSYFAFIRHGAYHQPKGVPSAHLPHPLTEDGFEHALLGAKRVQEFLRQKNLHLSDSVHSSNLLRAYQTALVYAQELGVPKENILQTESLCERCVGSMANLTVAEIEAILEKDPRFSMPPTGWKSSAHYCLPVPNAESLFQAGNRVYHTIEETMKKSAPGSLTLFIGHGASMRYAAHHMGIWSIEEVHAHSMHYGEPVIYEWKSKQHAFGNWKVRQKAEEAKD